MAVKVQTVMQIIEELAPKHLSEDWDNVGLIVGDARAELSGILVCLDLNLRVAAEAVERGANLIVTHHPPIFKALKRLDLSRPQGQLLAYLLSHNLNVYSAHTNLDSAPGGVSDVLAESLGLTNLKVLSPGSREQLYKLVVFVPQGYEEQIRQAMGTNGAGWIGNYSHCTFQTGGTGTFLPLAGTKPFLGRQGKLEYADEYRVETIVPQSRLKKVLAAVIKAHPYEEVAYDLYPLANEGKVSGLGRVGTLPEPQTLAEMAARVAGVLKLKEEALKIAGNPQQEIFKVAVCGGSGGNLVAQAAFCGAHLLVTGDVDYHQARDALDLNLAVIDAGHAATELPVVEKLVNYLTGALAEARQQLQVTKSKVAIDPWQRGFPGRPN